MLKMRVPFPLTILIGLILTITLPTQAADFSVGTAGDLITAINDANGTPTRADTITLTGNIDLTSVNNNADFVLNTGNFGTDSNGDGANGLPLITSEITIEGNGFTIARADFDPDNNVVLDFRIFAVSSRVSVQLEIYQSDMSVIGIMPNFRFSSPHESKSELCDLTNAIRLMSLQNGSLAVWTEILDRTTQSRLMYTPLTTYLLGEI